MLENFITKYNLDFQIFKYNEHFEESEGELLVLPLCVYVLISIFY
jgi:hypothetical protein